MYADTPVGTLCFVCRARYGDAGGADTPFEYEAANAQAAFVAERAAEGAYLAASAAVRASFATLNRARAGSLTPAQKQQVNELLEAMMRGDVVM